MEGPLPDIITGAAPENSTHVYFKDMIVAASDDSEEESEPSERGGTTHSGSEANKGSALHSPSLSNMPNLQSAWDAHQALSTPPLLRTLSP